MRICFLTTGDIQVTATMKRALGMAQPLIAAGHRVGILAWDTPANRGQLARECPDAEPLWVPGTLRAGSELVAKVRALRCWRPDVVYVCAYGIRNFVLRGWLSGGGRVVIEHSELRSAIPEIRRRRIWELCIEYASVLGADGLLCASRLLVDVYTRRARRLGRRLPILYHPYAYSAATLVPDPGKTQRFRGLADGRKVVLYMGTLTANYGILDILTAMRRLRDLRDDFVLQVLGHGRHEVQARARTHELGLDGAVRFQGYVPEEDLASWLATADVFLSPMNDTIQDKARCPSKVYMYLPFRKPIVTCPIGDPHELLGEDGFFYPPGDAAAMATTIAAALDASGTRQPRHVDPAHHTWDFRAAEFLELAQRQGWISPDWT